MLDPIALTMSSLPSNVHVSNHPCLVAKLSQLRSKNTNAKEVKALVHEISLVLGIEALASKISTVAGPEVCDLTLSPDRLSAFLMQEGL